jgi:hypothetical protein
MSSVIACAIFCSLKFHVVCTCIYFLWRHHLPPDKSENDQNSDSDWFSYWIDIRLLTLLFRLQYLSESCFGNDNTFLLPNPWVVLFFIYPTFYSLNNIDQKITAVEHIYAGHESEKSTWRENIDILNFHFLPTFCTFCFENCWEI